MNDITNAQKKHRENSFGYLIQTLAQRIDCDMKDRLKEHGVDLKVFANLMFLSEKDGITQREISNVLNFPEYHTSRNVDALIKQGFAERRTNPNSRRSILIFLTTKGHEMARELPAVIRASNDKTLAKLDDRERADVIALLQKSVGISTST